MTTQAGAALTRAKKGRRLTFELAQKYFSYDLKTGVIRWKIAKGTVAAGGKAGGADRDGYDAIGFDGRSYSTHRVAWLLMTGEWPPAGVDHRDRNKKNNRWKNLRAATQRQNAGNTKMNARNTTGIRGVSRSSVPGKWLARIRHGKKPIHLGSFKTKELAKAAYDKAARAHFGEFYHAG